MSNSTVYDSIVTALTTQFPTKTRIPYPYSLQDNQAQFLSDGIGIKVGSATYETVEWCSFIVARTVSVVVTREIFRTDSDAIVIDDTTKAILEDIQTIQKILFQMDQGNSANIVRVEVGDVSGVESVNGKFLSMEASFRFQINDSL